MKTKLKASLLIAAAVLVLAALIATDIRLGS